MPLFGSRGKDQQGQRPERERPLEQRQVTAPPRQVNLQFLDDTWERLLNALERLEQITEGYRNISAGRLDRHRDKDEIREDAEEIQSEVHLQIKCLQRVIHPVRDDAVWLVEDFLGWFGGREPRDLGAVDGYAVPILQCIIGEPYELPQLRDFGPPSERDILQATEAMASALHESDRIEEKFVQDPEQRATQHKHERAGMAEGVRRLMRLPDPWAELFLNRMTSKKETPREETPKEEKEEQSS